MKFNLLVPTTVFILIAACQGQKESSDHQHDSTSTNETVQADTVKKSIPREEHAQIGGTHFTIKYHAPAVRGRTIWGGLVPYDEVWVTGAHSATSLEFNKDITINNTKIPAGKYALFTIPGKDKWTIIVNKNWEQHLADEYDSKDDVVRLEVTPEIRSTIQERLKYFIVQEADSRASVNIAWEKVKVSLPVHLN